MSEMHQEISESERLSLIKKHPFFCLLTEQEVQQMAELMYEEIKNPQDIIVNEEDIVDKVYFIARGKAEVSRTVSRVDRTSTMHLSVLEAGDVIGLTKVGLFSTTGVRTAKVVALEPMVLLSIELSKFYSVSSSYPALKVIGEKFLLMNFIKNAAIFYNCTNEQIHKIADEVKKITVPAGTELQLKDASESKCYILLSGEIDAVDDEQKNLLMHQGDFFGSDSFLPKKYSSLKTKSDCVLFEVSHGVMMDVLKKQKKDKPVFVKTIGQKIKSLFKKRDI